MIPVILGRYNNIYELPREILTAIPGVEIVEMERNREDGMCCGACGDRRKACQHGTYGTSSCRQSNDD